MIQVVIADDHHLVRQGLKMLLNAQPEIKVIGEACNGQEAVELAQTLRPDIIILDISMPYLNGIEAAKQIRSLGLPARILILSMFGDESLVKKAFRSGIKGYLLKKSITEDLLSAVHKAYLNEYYLSPDLKMDIDPEQLSSTNQEPDLSERLTAREREICQMIADGKTNLTISYELKISVKTVEKHRANLMEKLGAQDVASLMRIAIQQALVVIER
jgi:two-component system, NarL family, response regulator NreC